jgi:hypothetical protein
MICTKCGVTNQDGAVFCSGCGKSMEKKNMFGRKKKQPKSIKAVMPKVEVPKLPEVKLPELEMPEYPGDDIEEEVEKGFKEIKQEIMAIREELNWFISNLRNTFKHIEEGYTPTRIAK